jgi:hypothetical protein
MLCIYISYDRPSAELMFRILGCTGQIDQLWNGSNSLRFRIEIPMAQYYKVFYIQSRA